MRIKQRYYIVRIDTLPEHTVTSTSSSSSYTSQKSTPISSSSFSTDGKMSSQRHPTIYSLTDIYNTLKQLFATVYGDIGIGSITNSFAVRHYYPEKSCVLVRILHEWDMALQNILTCVQTLPATMVPSSTGTGNKPQRGTMNVTDVPVRLRIVHIAGSLRTLTNALVRYYGIEYVYFWYTSTVPSNIVTVMEKHHQQSKRHRNVEPTENTQKKEDSILLSPEDMYTILQQQNFTVTF